MVGCAQMKTETRAARLKQAVRETGVLQVEIDRVRGELARLSQELEGLLVEYDLAVSRVGKLVGKKVYFYQVGIVSKWFSKRKCFKRYPGWVSTEGGVPQMKRTCQRMARETGAKAVFSLEEPPWL